MSRRQVGIERLPTRRLSNEPRESMNCKSCRKRKIKCNRLRPACEACQVFQCPCIYDAVPKKRGPKTDVLEALLKRVDGLEQRLKEQNKAEQATPSSSASKAAETGEGTASSSTAGEDAGSNSSAIDTPRNSRDRRKSAIVSPNSINEPSPQVQTDLFLDTYFARLHGKPYYILDESSLRQRLQLGQLPPYLVHAIYAVAARYTPHPGGYRDAVKLSEEWTSRARNEVDTDEPSVDALQALLLLVTAFTAAGKGRKAYMLLTNAIGMAMALEFHREMDSHAHVTPVEREMRRRLFWTCYLLDRFMACGSKRPSLIADKTILLRLPSWSRHPGGLPTEGEFFQAGSDVHHVQGGRRSQGSSAMLVDISRILGTTNIYLAAGGVKGDSHFPWHSLSNLSKIRQDLDAWASGMEDVFSSLDSLFGQPDSTVLVLSKLIYHLIHCLIYRPFLPIDLSELAGSGQHQSWQIEATNLCFLHANAIAELVELGRHTASIEWPAFVGYCICTAATVHVHGAHYNKTASGGEMNVFSSSSQLLSRAMQQLDELRFLWASIQHQRDMLRTIYTAHCELVKNLGSDSPMRYAPVFHLEDFFDRYSNITGIDGRPFCFDTANIGLADVVVDLGIDVNERNPLDRTQFSSARLAPELPDFGMDTVPSGHKVPSLQSRPGPTRNHSCSTAPPSSQSHQRPSHGSTGTAAFPAQRQEVPRQSAPLASPHETHIQGQQSQHLNDPHRPMDEVAANDAAVAVAAAAGFALTPHPHQEPGPHDMSSLAGTAFGQAYNFASVQPSVPGSNSHAAPGPSSYDPMFGDIPTNAFSSPAPWQADDGATGSGATKAALNQSPGAASESLSHSTGTGPWEEKDPFLSLLEQLAENESVRGQGSDLDFFLAGGSQSS
ncbi:hypothetical protein VTK73DRAFT_4265 [Phialemonium thermophilum]|uniref:Zn(2)-C6 fungal-type domain-containing protein n=1 Tax=Phialemonium thermophilum TaxID=223376 RepID=A0ABR3WUX3_9PEZI